MRTAALDSPHVTPRRDPRRSLHAPSTSQLLTRLPRVTDGSAGCQSGLLAAPPNNKRHLVLRLPVRRRVSAENRHRA